MCLLMAHGRGNCEGCTIVNISIVLYIYIWQPLGYVMNGMACISNEQKFEEPVSRSVVLCLKSALETRFFACSRRAKPNFICGRQIFCVV